MKHVCKIITLAGMSLAVGACSSLVGKEGYFRDKGGDYADAKVYPELSIPENLKPVAQDELMVIPDISTAFNAQKEHGVPRADQRIVQGDGTAYQIVSNDTGRVLKTSRSVAELWPLLIRFWGKNNIPLVQESPAAGEMVTGWTQIDGRSNPGLFKRMVGKVVKLEDRELSKEKFRLLIHSGKTAGASEIQLQHARRPLDSDDAIAVQWGQVGQSRTDSLNNSMLDELMVYLIQGAGDDDVSLKAQKLNVLDQTSMIKDGNGNPALKIQQNFAHSWQAVEAALKKAGIEVTDLNRSAGLFYVVLPGLDKPEAEKSESPKEKSWLDKLSSDDDEDKPVDKDADNFRIRLQPVGSGTTHVTLEKDINTLPAASISEQLLARVRKNLG